MSDHSKNLAEAFTAMLSEQLEGMRSGGRNLTAERIAILAASTSDRPNVEGQLAELRKCLPIVAEMGHELQSLITAYEEGLRLAANYRKGLQ